MSRWIAADPPLAKGDYLGDPDDLDTDHDYYWQYNNDKTAKLPGMGGVFNPINLDAYQYAGQNPVKMKDADGNQFRNFETLNSKLKKITLSLKKVQKNLQRRTGFKSPVEGIKSSDLKKGSYITSKFGERTHPIFGTKSFHNGIDIGRGPGKGRVLASKGGTIKYHDYGDGKKGGLGYCAVIDHGDGTKSIYGHLNRQFKGNYKSGKVSTGQVIGIMGTTGNSTGRHLHFTIMVGTRPKNPVDFLSE